MTRGRRPAAEDQLAQVFAVSLGIERVQHRNGNQPASPAHIAERFRPRRLQQRDAHGADADARLPAGGLGIERQHRVERRIFDGADHSAAPATLRSVRPGATRLPSRAGPGRSPISRAAPLQQSSIPVP
jgi:hypothetical protein